MAISPGMNRRSFLAMAGTVTGAVALGTQTRSLHALAAPASCVAYVAAAGDGIHVYAVQRGRWQLRQSIAAEAPIAMALHPEGHTLYALHAVKEYMGLPRGYVEAYRVDAASGQLSPLAQQPLSLSATLPRHFAVTPNGDSVIVAVHGGGAYNRLPILADGMLGRVSHIRKETGSGPVALHQTSAHPQAVAFDPAGNHIFTADQGNDMVSVLAADSLEVLARHALPAGSGPSYLALHSGRVFVSNAFSGSLLGLGYDAKAASITAAAEQDGAFGGPLAVHPGADVLYAANKNGITALRIHSADGSLRPFQQWRSAGSGKLAAISGLSFSAEQNALLATTRAGVASIAVNALSGHLEDAKLVVAVPESQSVVFAARSKA